METYVDTCFLMNETGRLFLQKEGIRPRFICTVKQELEKHKEHAESKEAMDLLHAKPDLVEIIKKLPEERDIEKSLADNRFLTADSVFRRLAIRYEAESKKVRFLTADMALAEALSRYGAEILYLSRRDNSVSNWQEFREKRRVDSLSRVPEMVQYTDMVLTSSALQSPYLEQFLLNIKGIALPAKHLPILHPVSVENCAHLSWKVLEMLDDSNVIRKNGCEINYPTEQSLLDALYYARQSGRSVCMLVSGWDDVVCGYDARSRAAEIAPDEVRFCVLLPWGEPSPLMAHKRGNLFAKKVQNSLAQSSSISSELAAAGEHRGTPEETAGQNKRRPLSMEAFSGLAHRYNPKVGVRVRQGTPDSIAEELKNLNPDEPEAMIVLGILSARRQNKPQLIDKLIGAVNSIHPYCLQHWFRSGTGGNSPKSSTILKSDVFFKLTKRIIAKSQNLTDCCGLVNRFKSFRHIAPERIDEILQQVQARGAK